MRGVAPCSAPSAEAGDPTSARICDNRLLILLVSYVTEDYIFGGVSTPVTIGWELLSLKSRFRQINPISIPNAFIWWVCCFTFITLPGMGKQLHHYIIYIVTASFDFTINCSDISMHKSIWRYDIFTTRYVMGFVPGKMTSSNGNFFRVSGPLCGEFTGEFPSQMPVTQSLVFFSLMYA